MKIHIDNIISNILYIPGVRNVYTSHKNSNAPFNCIEKTAQRILEQEAIMRVQAFSIVLRSLVAGPGLIQGSSKLSLENIITSSTLQIAVAI